MREQPVLQAGEELQEVPSLGEVEGRPLDPVLADQHHRPATVHCHHDQPQKTQQEVTTRHRDGALPANLPPPGMLSQTHGLAPGLWERPGQKAKGRFYLPRVPFIPPAIIVDWEL